ncbi:MAG: glycerol-3-phosphate acyltransferase [Dehalococcoidia bacterium]|nr:glycerol-3-phosphate acyltransferase [Dehalococcoidia bacterium]MDD5494379.1 glycerol-3-phosphate acyltransferase [Dehalococcoidia bacterium]
MTLLLYAAIIVTSYVLGSVPFMILIARAKGIDITREPDLHQAMWFKVGRAWGITGALLDVLKGIVPVLLCYLLGLPPLVSSLSGIAAVCGQMWPVFRKFKGERGNTTGLGAAGTLSFAYGQPLVLWIALVPPLIGFAIRTFHRWKTSGNTLNERLRFGGPPSLALPLGVIIGFGSTPVTSALFGLAPEITLGFAGIVLVIIIRRLTVEFTEDRKSCKAPWWSMLFNRLLFDRSEI